VASSNGKIVTDTVAVVLTCCRWPSLLSLLYESPNHHFRGSPSSSIIDATSADGPSSLRAAGSEKAAELVPVSPLLVAVEGNLSQHARRDRQRLGACSAAKNMGGLLALPLPPAPILSPPQEPVVSISTPPPPAVASPTSVAGQQRMLTPDPQNPGPHISSMCMDCGLAISGALQVCACNIRCTPTTPPSLAVESHDSSQLSEIAHKALEEVQGALAGAEEGEDRGDGEGGGGGEESDDALEQVAVCVDLDLYQQ